MFWSLFLILEEFLRILMHEIVLNARTKKEEEGYFIKIYTKLHL